MKSLFFLLALTLLSTLVWFAFFPSVGGFAYIVDKEILDLSTPFSGKIDLDLLKSLKDLPNEQ